MRKNFLIVGIAALSFALVGAYVGMRNFATMPPQNSAVATLLSQSLPDPSGADQALSKWKGKPLLVNFWATWCAPCVEEMPELSALQPQIAPDGIQIIGIGIDSQANIAEFASKYKIAYPLYVGGMSATELSRQLGNKAGGLPFTLLIDADGSVKRTYLGRLKMETLRKDLAAFQTKT
jgi:thiol-disulfide isomerase/thioredoxin